MLRALHRRRKVAIAGDQHGRIELSLNGVGQQFDRDVDIGLLFGVFFLGQVTVDADLLETAARTRLAMQLISAVDDLEIRKGPESIQECLLSLVLVRSCRVAETAEVKYLTRMSR